MKRAYSILTLKAVDDEQRILEGTATTPTPDRVGDIVEPRGAQFNLPIPFLWQHDSRQPLGHVVSAKVTDAGIFMRAQLVKVDEPGTLKDRLDECWLSIKHGLVRGLSIGFKDIEYSRIGETYSYRYLKWLWLELSAVTIPANGDCSIQGIKSADQLIRRTASGAQAGHRVVRLGDAGPSGKSIPGASGESQSRRSGAVYLK